MKQLKFIIGPCMAESKELLDEVAQKILEFSKKFSAEFIFKASFDKANRTSAGSDRGPGLAQVAQWFKALKEKYPHKIITDIHLPDQIHALADAVDCLQVPAFLCRQTDLLQAAIASGKLVNIKKGQFVSPWDAENIVDKCKKIAREQSVKLNMMLTERGYTFGYNQLVVDMRGFEQMARYGVPIVYDVTHSMQLPGKNPHSPGTSGGTREYALSTARAAAATGFVSGFFIEMHPNPAKALSDSAVQVDFGLAEKMIEQIIDIHNLVQSKMDV